MSKPFQYDICLIPGTCPREACSEPRGKFKVLRLFFFPMPFCFRIVTFRNASGSSSGQNPACWRSRRQFNGLAHRNRIDFCDLRLRCPLRTPEIACNLLDKTKQCWIAIQCCAGKSTAICNFELRLPSPKPRISAGFLTIWLRQPGNR